MRFAWFFVCVLEKNSKNDPPLEIVFEPATHTLEIKDAAGNTLIRFSIEHYSSVGTALKSLMSAEKNEVSLLITSFLDDSLNKRFCTLNPAVYGLS